MLLDEHSSRSRYLKNALRLVILGILFFFASAPFAAERLMLISTGADAESSSELSRQLEDWERSGIIADAELFESEPGDEAQFQLFGILRFTDEHALQTWNAAAAEELGPSVTRTEVDLLAELGSSPVATAGSVFQVMQYDVFIDRAQFEDYIEGYQMPEMRAREFHGGLTRYSSYYARPGSTASWQSLIIMEYRNKDAFEESKTLNKKLGEQLAMTDARFKELKKTKLSLRNKTATTRARWVELSNSSTHE